MKAQGMMKLCVGAVVLVLVTLQCSITGASADCSQATVSSCVAPIQAYRSVANLDDTQFNEACGKVVEISTCLSKAGCPESDATVKAVWLGLKNGFDYICNEGKTDILAGRPCLKEKAQKALDACTANYTSATNQSNAPFCPAANTLLSCIKTNTLASCSSVTARVYVTYTYKVLDPSASVRACTLDQSVLQINSAHLLAPPTSRLLLVAAFLGLLGFINSQS